MAERHIWQKPALHFEGEREEERAVTWLELFFDLFFVVTIAELTHSLSAHPSWENAGTFVVLFIPLWWLWIGHTYYNERFESDGMENRLFTFLLMVPVIGLSVFANDGLNENFPGYVLSYAAGRFIITALYLRAAFHVKEFRPTGIRYVIGFSTSITLIVIAAFTEGSIRYVLFVTALAIDMLTPVATTSHQQKLPRFSTSKLPERYGLFVIIVLGEMIVGIASGLASLDHLTVSLFINATLGVMLGLGMWWIYFDFIARRAPKAHKGWSFIWGYLHIPLVLAIAATGAGISSVIGEDGILSEEKRQLIGSAIGVALISIGCIEITLKREAEHPTYKFWSPALKIAAGLLALTIAWLDIVHNSFTLVIIMLFCLFIQMIYGAWIWFYRQVPQEIAGPTVKNSGK